jgi:hypothetical protein
LGGGIDFRRVRSRSNPKGRPRNGYIGIVLSCFCGFAALMRGIAMAEHHTT